MAFTRVTAHTVVYTVVDSKWDKGARPGIKIRISIEKKIPVKNSHNSKINICHQTVSVTAGKMKEHLQIAT